MDLSKGLEQLKQSINGYVAQQTGALLSAFERLKNDVEGYVSESAGAYRSLSSFAEQDNKPQREHEPDGFAYGYEIIPSIRPPEKIPFPLIYDFWSKAATGIEKSSGCAHLLYGFALRSIISFPMGDSNVYMVDSNVSGDFNTLSQISKPLDDAEAEKPYFHYITSVDERAQLLTDLASILDNNIRNYVYKFPDLRAYNRQNQSMHVPYHFVFVKDIEETFTEKNQIDRMCQLIKSNNATKAGIFIFYTYDKNNIKTDPDSYYADTSKAMRQLLSLSHLISAPGRHYAESVLQIEDMANQEVSEKIVGYVEKQKPPITVMTFKDVIQKKLDSGVLWNPPYSHKKAQLPFVVGFQNAVTPKVVDVKFKGTSPHIFIGGKSGSGKSILLHNFILNGALRYSPEQLQFYLVDMKGGVSFAPYKKLPHVVALSASSSRHYAKSLLELFDQENERRLALFKRVGAPLLDDYNELMSRQGKPQLPFLFGIIDEFQDLFDQNDAISQAAEKLIRKIHKLSRAAGIFLALCTQQAPGNVDRSQVGNKMSLICNPNDSNTLIGNTGASRLRGIGRAIINTNETGEERYNQEFQVAFIHEVKELPVYVEKISQIYLKQHQGVDPLDHLCYDDNDRAARLQRPMVEAMKKQNGQSVPRIYVGIPGFFRKEHAKFWFHRDSLSNVAIVGNDRPTALRLTGIICLQFMSAYKQQGARVFISDLQKTSEPTHGKLSFMQGMQGLSHTGMLELKDNIKQVYQLLCERKEHPMESTKEPEVLYALLDLKPDNNFTATTLGGFNFGDEAVEKSNMDMLKELVEDGPNYGIHILAYSYNYSNMETLLNSFNNSLLPQFEVKIAVRGGSSTKLLRLYGTGEVAERYGEAVIQVPEEMGLKYKGDDEYGDPFLVYDTLDDQSLQGTAWDTLFRNLPNKEE